MPEREARTVRVDPSVWSTFRDQIDEWDGENAGHVGYHVEQALKEYVDHDRYARVEDKLDRVLARVSDSGGSHTHKPENSMNRSSAATEKARKIIRRLHKNHEEVISVPDVERAIEDIAGVDDRTIRKYKRLFRRRGLLFEHPGQSAVWTSDVDQWVAWLEEYGSLNGPDAVQDFTDPYPVGVYATADGVQIEIGEELKQ